MLVLQSPSLDIFLSPPSGKKEGICPLKNGQEILEYIWEEMEEKKNTRSTDRPPRERGRKEKRKRKNNKTRKGEAGLAQRGQKGRASFYFAHTFFSFPSGKMEKKRR